MPKLGEKKIIRFKHLCVWDGSMWAILCSAPRLSS